MKKGEKEESELDRFARESIPILKANGYLNEERVEKEVKSINWGFISVLALIIIGLYLFYYGGTHDWFKDEITIQPQDVLVNNTYNNRFDPNVNIDNQYDFNPQHNITIINNITNST